jgi:hypothetical protein
VRKLNLWAAFAAVSCFLMLSASSAAADEWHSETPVAARIGVPAPLGEIGDVAFEAPNRGVLVTAGIQGVMPAGVYAYDGTGWHLYSTVCGGQDGSVAWAGPNEFWTVAAYANKQEGSPSSGEEVARTLCRFANGEVVASYAEPFGSETAYEKMEAAACNGPSNCWFAGVPVASTAPNQGPFHIHWDGASVTAVPSLTETQPRIENGEGTVTGLTFFAGALIESVTKAPYLREVSLAQPEIFTPVPLPEGVSGPFAIGSDGGQLWAVSEAEPVALRSIGLGFERIPLGRRLNGGVESPVVIATEPNGAAIWAAEAHFSGGSATVVLTHISASGAESEPLTLPRPAEELNPKGAPTALACPSAGQCWLATSKGWLFHLGGPLPQDTDPAMHVVISSRPTDNSTRSFVPAGLPQDNSGETEPTKSLGEVPLEKFPVTHKRKTLVSKVHQTIIGKRTLQLSFVLYARAHVQLVASFHKKVVAKTPKLTMAKGTHELRLKLDPKRWPTGLDFRVHPVSKKAS